MSEPEPPSSSDDQNSFPDADIGNDGTPIWDTWNLLLGTARRIAFAIREVKDDGSKVLLRQLVYDLLSEADYLYTLIPREDIWLWVDCMEAEAMRQDKPLPLPSSDRALEWETLLRHGHSHARERWLKYVQKKLGVNFTNLASLPAESGRAKMPDFKTWIKFKDHGVMGVDQQDNVEAVLQTRLPGEVKKLMESFRRMLDPEVMQNIPPG